MPALPVFGSFHYRKAAACLMASARTRASRGISSPLLCLYIRGDEEVPSVFMIGRDASSKLIPAYAFSGRADLKKVVVPDSVEAIGDFAFYDCPELREIEITDRTVNLHHGVFRKCPKLSFFHIRFLDPQPSFRIFKEILNELDSRIRFFLDIPMGQAELTFPSYEDGFQEDTMARAIHEKIEGCGYQYRQTVTREKLDFKAYDRLFSFAEYDTRETAARIAIGRLRYPAELRKDYRERYQEYLIRENTGVLRMLVEERDVECIRFLASQNLITEEALAKTLPLLARNGFSEYAAILMQYQGTHFRKYNASSEEQFVF